MANTVVIVVRIMPKSLDSNLNEIENQIKNKMESEGGKSITFEEKPLAFGLKAIILKMAFPEEKGTDIIESII
jgi:translation elongation factor aEF-1 beta